MTQHITHAKKHRYDEAKSQASHTGDITGPDRADDFDLDDDEGELDAAADQEEVRHDEHRPDPGVS